jgi:response regulator NasT
MEKQDPSPVVRVLIADDDDRAREAIVEQLKMIGHDVVGAARNGTEAVELALSLNPEVAILDIKMPDGDGLHAAEAIMEKSPMAILMLTAFDDDDLVKRARELGVFAYMVKPATIQMLKTSIEISLARFEELQAARKETADLKEALETRKLVERAKGILMQRLDLSEADAFRRLQRESNNQSRPLKQIAEAILIAEGIYNKKSEA